MSHGPKSARDRLIFALDVPNKSAAIEYVKMLDGEVGLFKVGLELFVSEGPDILKAVREHSPDTGIFLDLKLHDIPATVAGAVRSAGKSGVRFLTVHCGGGEAMLAAAALAARDTGIGILGVTLLTHMTTADLGPALGFREDLTPQELVLARADLAHQSGTAGIVCSGSEVRVVKHRWPDDLLTVVPGIRPAGTSKDDQGRVTTPADAIQAGADYLVVGRPIRDADDPRQAARGIVAEIDQALRNKANP